MVYSVNKLPANGTEAGNQAANGNTGPDYVSAAIMAKVLEERSKERNLKNGQRIQKCSTCRNRRVSIQYFDQTTQTPNGVVTYDDVNYFPSNQFKGRGNLTGGQGVTPNDSNGHFMAKSRSGSVSSASTASIESLPSASSSNIASQWPPSFAINSQPTVADNQRQQQQSVQFGNNGFNSYATSQQAASQNATIPTGQPTGVRSGQYYPPNNYYASRTVKSNETMII